MYSSNSSRCLKFHRFVNSSEVRAGEYASTPHHSTVSLNARSRSAQLVSLLTGSDRLLLRSYLQLYKGVQLY